VYRVLEAIVFSLCHVNPYVLLLLPHTGKHTHKHTHAIQ